ncbi:DUF2686 family protein, partial [Escherichia coli]|nr:DUF2686 family protein [Escherichia coli]
MHVICLLLFLLQKNLSIFLNISEILIKVTIMSMPLSNALQSQIITDDHFLHHPKVDNELTRKYERARLDT